MTDADTGMLSEHDAHRVLARAVELDVRETSDVSLEQLHAIAEEAGIAPAALAQALHELRSGELRLPAVARRNPSEQLGRFRGYAVLGIAVGVSAFTPGDVLVLNAMLGVPLYGLYELSIRILRARERGGPSAPSMERPKIEKPPVRAHDQPDRGLSLRLSPGLSLLAAAVLFPLSARAQASASPACPTGISFEFQVDTRATYVVDSSHTVQPTKAIRDPRNLLQFVVDTTGVISPLSVKVLRGTDVNIVDQARASLQAWRFTPATKGGRAVCQLVQTPIDTVSRR